MSPLPPGFAVVAPRVSKEKGVSLAYRRIAHHTGPSLVVGITKALMTELGWSADGYLLFAHEPNAGHLLFQQAAAADMGARKCSNRHGNASVAFRAGWIAATVMPQRAAEIPFEVTEHGLLLTLPDYAAPTRVGRLRASAARDQALGRATGKPAAPR